MIEEPASLMAIPPERIRKNPENPRLHFKEEEMDDLLASIDAVRILVPLSVYTDPDDQGHEYVLIDGERRWRCALKLGLAKVPAIVLPRPDPTDNLKSMFNIHMVREQWEDMPMAWALSKLIERTGTSEVNQLAQITGLHPRRVERLKHALSLSTEQQHMIDSGAVPLNFFFELDRAVLRPLAAERPDVFGKFALEGKNATEVIREAFVEKKLAGITRDTVELRDVRPIISAATKQAGGPQGASELDAAIEDLIRTPERTIRETYENTVEMVVEAEKFAKQCRAIVCRFDLLMGRAQADEDREMVARAVQSLVAELSKRMESHGMWSGDANE